MDSRTLTRGVAAVTARGCEVLLQQTYLDIFKKPYSEWQASCKQADRSRKLFEAFTPRQREARFLL